MKLEDERNKILKEKQENQQQQQLFNEILSNPDANQEKLPLLNDKYQIKLNRTLELQRELNTKDVPPSVIYEDYINSEDVPGLGVKGMKVERKRKMVGDLVESTDYGKIVDPKDFQRPKDETGDSLPSKEEVKLLKNIDIGMKKFSDDLERARIYGAVTDGKNTYTEDELKQYFDSQSVAWQLPIKRVLKENKSLGLYDKLYNKHRQVDGKFKSMNDQEKLAYAQDYISSVEKAYTEGEISQADLKLYQYLFELDMKRSYYQTKVDLQRYAR